MSSSATVPHLPQRSRAIQAIIFLNSDWHIGSGAGRAGDTDRLIQRDSDGMPFIPGKQLTGLWRDACERVAYGLDGGQEHGQWNLWVDYLFGDQPARSQGPVNSPPRPAAVSIRSARLPNSLRQAVTGRPALREAMTFVKPGVSLNPRSGHSRTKYLRFEEMARCGAALTAECTFLNNEEPACQAYALLVAGSRLLLRLGGKRRRGAGRCRIVLHSEAAEEWIDWIEQNPEPGNPPPVAVSSLPPEMTSPPASQLSSDWDCVNLTLTAETPIIITARTTGNTNETLDYMPGTMLLPLIARTLAGLGQDVSGAIACGDLIVTHATREVSWKQDNEVVRERGRPVPAALFYEKMGGGLEHGRGVYNRLQESVGEAQLKGYRTGYVATAPPGCLPSFEQVALSLGTHNTIDDASQRPTEEVGGIYSYEAIGAGTRLCAQLRLRRGALGALPHNWVNRLPKTERIGTAKKDDYGAVSIEASTFEPYSVLSPPENGQLTVWILSDVLLRDRRLRPTASVAALAAALGKALRVTLHLHNAPSGCLSSLARHHRTDSWQTRWGLPRPSLVGLAAGTCVVFEVEGQIQPGRLAEVATSGLGERRAEGYGQMCFNDPLVTAPLSSCHRTLPGLKEPHEVPAPIATDDLSFAYAHIIEQEAWRRAFQSQAQILADTSDFRQQCLGITSNKPSSSQLGGVRSVISYLQGETGQDRVLDWIAHVQAKNEADGSQARWPPGGLANLRALVQQRQRIWSLLALDEAGLTMTENGGTAMRQKLWAEAIRTVVDACLRAHHRATESRHVEAG